MNVLRQRWELVGWLALSVIGMGLVFFRISHEALWSDEAATMAIAEHGFRDMLRIVGQGGDSHPPLYHFAIKIFISFFGASRGVFRSFSAMGLLTAALILGAGPVSRVFNHRVGLIFAVLMLFSSMNLTQAQEMRMYTWAMFFMSACAVMGYLYVRDGRSTDLILFGMASLGGVYIHYYVMIGVFFVHLYLLVWILLCNWSRIRPFLGEAVIVAILFSPWIFSLLNQVTRNVENFWILAPSMQTLGLTLTIPFAVKTGSLSFAVYLAAACFSLYAYGLMMAWKKQRDIVFMLIAAGVFFSVLAAVLLFSLTLRPILVPRYMMPLWGLLFMGVAWGLDQFFQWRSRWGSVAGFLLLGLYILLSVPSLQLVYFFQLNGPMDEVGAFGRENFKKGHAFVHFDETTLPVFAVQFPDYRHLVYQAPTSLFYDTFDPFSERVSVVKDLKTLSAGSEGLWIVSTPSSQNYEAYIQASSFFGRNPDRIYNREELTPEQEAWAAQQGVLRFATPLSDFVVDLQLVLVR